MAIAFSQEMREKILEGLASAPGFIRKDGQILMEFDSLDVVRLPGKRLSLIFSFQGEERFTFNSPCRIPRGGRMTVNGISGTMGISVET